MGVLVLSSLFTNWPAGTGFCSAVILAQASYVVQSLASFSNHKSRAKMVAELLQKSEGWGQERHCRNILVTKLLEFGYRLLDGLGVAWLAPLWPRSGRVRPPHLSPLFACEESTTGFRGQKNM